MAVYHRSQEMSLSMLARRLLVAVVLIPIGFLVITLGGTLYNACIVAIIGVSAWEYTRLFNSSGYQPAGVLLIGGATLFVLGRAWNGFDSSAPILVLLLMASMAYHLIAFERGRQLAGADFGVTLSGALYVGWLGAYLVSLRNLPQGEWWVLLALPSVWLVDTGAYFVGTRLGRHRLSPRLSPNKTWEGVAGGAMSSIIGTALLAAAYQSWVGLPVSPIHGALLGAVLALLTPLGDLGESMIKRQAGVKDSGNLLPGHGGVFDRIDSWLWAAALSYYLISWLVLS
jgi:phosphatidate cytidylyltransferase